MPNETYKVHCKCTNCDYNGKTEIEKGMKVEESECPTCGCKTLNKVQNIVV